MVRGGPGRSSLGAASLGAALILHATSLSLGAASFCCSRGLSLLRCCTSCPADWPPPQQYEQQGGYYGEQQQQPYEQQPQRPPGPPPPKPPAGPILARVSSVVSGAGRRKSGRGVARDAFAYPTTDAGARNYGRDAREDGPRGRLRRRRARRALWLLLVVGLLLLLAVVAALLLILLGWWLLQRRRRRRRRRAPLAPLAARRCCRCEQRCNGDGSSSFHAAAVAGHCCKQQE